jgi:hypothetical protein
MEKTLGKEYEDPIKRRLFLKDNCDSVVEMGYMKPFDHEKVQELKDRLSEISIEINEVEEAKKSAVTQFNAELKPKQDEKSFILRGIKERAEYVKEDCYKFVDNDEKMVGFYNSEGDLIESRPAHPNELQATIHQELRRTGTHD